MYHVVMNNVFRRQLLSPASAIFLCHATSAHQLEDLFIEGLGDPARVGEIFPLCRCNTSACLVAAGLARGDGAGARSEPGRAHVEHRKPPQRAARACATPT